MKRFTAAALAATTAISLAAVPAQAAEAKASSEVSDAEAIAYGQAAYLTGHITPTMKSIIERQARTDKNVDPAESLTSSIKNDAASGYKLGTTFDILWGTGVAVVLLGALAAAASSGVIPGVTLPALPF